MNSIKIMEILRCGRDIMNETPEILLDRPPLRTGEIEDKGLRTQMFLKGANPEDKIIIREADNRPGFVVKK